MVVEAVRDIREGEEILMPYRSSKGSYAIDLTTGSEEGKAESPPADYLATLTDGTRLSGWVMTGFIEMLTEVMHNTVFLSFYLLNSL